MQYYWHVITSREGWETLTKQDVNYPTSFPVLAGCVQLSETEFVVCPLPVADIANLLAGITTMETASRDEVLAAMATPLDLGNPKFDDNYVGEGACVYCREVAGCGCFGDAEEPNS